MTPRLFGPRSLRSNTLQISDRRSLLRQDDLHAHSVERVIGDERGAGDLERQILDEGVDGTSSISSSPFSIFHVPRKSSSTAWLGIVTWPVAAPDVANCAVSDPPF